MPFCRCKYTAREEYAPALLKHRLDNKLKNLQLHPEDHVALDRSLVVTSAPYDVDSPDRKARESLRCVLVIGVAVLGKYRGAGQEELGLHGVCSMGYCQDVGEGTGYVCTIGRQYALVCANACAGASVQVGADAPLDAAGCLATRFREARHNNRAPRGVAAVDGDGAINRRESGGVAGTGRTDVDKCVTQLVICRRR